MSKHTPAPWYFGHNIGVYAKGDIQIADISPSKNFDETLANAKLIAAAPELLEALERALHDFRKMTWTEETYIVIESAIKKATL